MSLAAAAATTTTAAATTAATPADETVSPRASLENEMKLRM